MRFRAFLLAAIMILPSWAFAGPHDREIAEQIAGKLQASGQLRAYNIRVKVEDGTAWLRGRVADQQQMNTAITLAFQTKGVEQVANGLTVWTGPETRETFAPLASREPEAPAIDQARLVPRPSVPTMAPIRIPELTPAQMPATPDPGEDLALDSVPLPNTIEQASQLLGDSPDHLQSPAEPLRNPDFVWSDDSAPATAQKACYWATVGQLPSMEHHMATVLAGAIEPMVLPDDSGDGAGEALACDEPEAPPILLPAAQYEPSAPDSSTPGLTLIQKLPAPAPRPWTGSFRERGEPRMQALLEE